MRIILMLASYLAVSQPCKGLCHLQSQSRSFLECGLKSVWSAAMICRVFPQRSAPKHALAAARGRGGRPSKAQGIQERACPAGQSSHPRHASKCLVLTVALVVGIWQSSSNCAPGQGICRSGRASPLHMVTGLERRQGILLRGTKCCSFTSS